MNKFTLLFLLIFAIAKINAQNYQISFLGTGASTNVDSVEVENLTQCTDTIIGGNDILYLTGNLGLRDVKIITENTINIYPNPFNGSCSVEFEVTEQGETNIELFDITGKIIFHLKEFLTKGLHTYRMNGVSCGIYMLKIESDKYSYKAKIVSTNATFFKPEIKHIGSIPAVNEQPTVSITGNLKGLKSIQSIIYIQYNAGDIMMLTGKSGIYRTIFMLVEPIPKLFLLILFPVQILMEITILWYKLIQ